MTLATRDRLNPRQRQALRLLTQGYDILFLKTGELLSVAGKPVVAIMGRPIDQGGGQGYLLTQASFECFRDRGFIEHVKSFRSRRTSLWRITETGRAAARK